MRLRENLIIEGGKTPLETKALPDLLQRRQPGPATEPKEPGKLSCLLPREGI